MKATGIVRRIDDLGRIVIPKEIRRVLHIKDSDPIEIFAGREGEIILRKYSPIGELDRFARDLVDCFYDETGKTVCILDREAFVGATGAMKQTLEGKNISAELASCIEGRKAVLFKKSEKGIPLTEKGNHVLKEGVVVPIICQGDCLGGVLVIWENVAEEEKLVTSAKIIATFVARQLEL